MSPHVITHGAKLGHVSLTIRTTLAHTTRGSGEDRVDHVESRRAIQPLTLGLGGHRNRTTARSSPCSHDTLSIRIGMAKAEFPRRGQERVKYLLPDLLPDVAQGSIAGVVCVCPSTIFLHAKLDRGVYQLFAVSRSGSIRGSRRPN